MLRFDTSLEEKRGWREKRKLTEAGGVSIKRINTMPPLWLDPLAFEMDGCPQEWPAGEAARERNVVRGQGRPSLAIARESR